MDGDFEVSGFGTFNANGTPGMVGVGGYIADTLTLPDQGYAHAPVDPTTSVLGSPSGTWSLDNVPINTQVGLAFYSSVPATHSLDAYNTFLLPRRIGPITLRDLTQTVRDHAPAITPQDDEPDE